MHTLKAFLIALAVLLVADGIWLGLLMKSFYSNELGDLARHNGGSMAPRWGSAVLVYLLIPGGIALFVRPLLEGDTTWPTAIGWGAAYGLIVYGVYDLTNRAVIDQWSLRMTLIDIVWGSALCALTGLTLWATRAWWA